MANPFGKMQEYFSSPNRVTHDWSFQNNLTLKMGKITPCLYIPLTPGESVRIKPTFGFNFEPMVFPVQTRMRAHLHFFYVRYKDLYKDWLDKFGMTKQGLEMPYMKLTEENRDMINTGEIGDYFNIPTVTYGSFGSTSTFNVEPYFYDFESHGYLQESFALQVTIPEVGMNYNSFVQSKSADYQLSSYRRVALNAVLPPIADIKKEFKLYVLPLMEGVEPSSIQLFALDSSGVVIKNLGDFEYDVLPSDTLSTGGLELPSKYIQLNNLPESTYSIYIQFSAPESVTTIGDAYSTIFVIQHQASSYLGLENKDQELANLPFASTSNEDGERLVNFPFRAYEFVYNSFYRDERNNPYKIDGQVEYNKYLPSTEGGADTYHYKLRNINWEQDFLTTATQSPQFGVAPLVGITSTGTMTFADEEGNTYTAQAKVGNDGDTITGISVHSPDMPSGTLRALIDTVSSGISISDFRNVNALQRLLEKRMRHGLKYVDMVQASFGTRPKNLEISMPEFIGGVNHDVIVNAVSQTTDTVEVPLGTKGGTASVLGTSDHKISCYADDFGCIIGLIYIAPVPNYSQLLPKHFFASEALDYFHPEFGHIGYQPIYNKEVAPLQFFRDDKANDTDNYNSVFGYQRPWYDMISKTDEVHGNFRNSKRRYLINRVFDTPPALTEDFLLVHADQVNDVFAVTEDTDKIFGEVYFAIKRKNAVPTLAIPRLES